MLDDMNVLKQRDPQDALGIAANQWKQLKHLFTIDYPPSGEIHNVVMAGMGGSAWPGVFLGSWPRLKIPFEIVRNYDIPPYVGKNTLFIASSYSGNTEETLSAVEKAEVAGAQVVVFSSGGVLTQRAKDYGHVLFEFPAGGQPRMSTFYFLRAFIQLFEPLGLIEPGHMDQLNGIEQWLQDIMKSWLPTVPTDHNPAKQLANRLIGKSVVIYGGPLTYPVANKWKICINENAKNVAWVNQFPEYNHNEFIGWTSHPVDKPYGIVEIRSNLEHPRVQKRFEISDRLLSGMRPAAHIIQPDGDTLMKQLLWTSVLGDFVSIYMAILNGVDPTPVELVERLKHELG